MKVIRTVAEMRELGAEWKSTPDVSVALVPTMGALHKGHGRLMQRAKALADVTVVSSFVNSLQFNEKGDLDAYPRTPEEDHNIAEKMGIDYFFEPSHEEMYPHGFLTSVHVAHLGTKLEGASRPGHFRGVCTVVTKLFNIVQPDYALFGHKDAQQLVIIQHMVRDLCIPVKIVGVATERDKTGLALSSRNSRLNDEQKRHALCLVRALKRVHFLVKRQGIVHSGELLQAIRSAINSAGDQVRMDYAKIVSRTTLEDIHTIERGNTLVLVAATVGGVRLIDSTRI